MKKLLIIPFVIGIGLLLSGCGITDKIAEKTIETASDNQVDVNVKDNNFTVNTNEGTLEIGEKTSLPDNFPSDVYVVDGNIMSATTVKDNNGFTLSIESNDTQANIKTKYQTELADNGWVIDSSFDITGISSITATKDNRSVVISITDNSEDNTTIVGISTFDK